MEFKKNILICTSRQTYLYRLNGGDMTLLATEETKEVQAIVGQLRAHKIKEFRLIDWTTEHVIRLERCPKILKMWQFFQWYWQKLQFARSSFFRSLLRSRYKSREALLLGIPEASPLVPLLTQLDQTHQFSFQLISGPLEQGQLLFSLVAPLRNASQKDILLVSIGKDWQLGQWLFRDGHLQFWRHWVPALRDDVEGQLLPAVFSLLRYLDKITNVKELDVIFFSEHIKDGSAFMSAFPNGSFFTSEDIIAFAEREGYAALREECLFHGLLAQVIKPLELVERSWEKWYQLVKRRAPKLLQAGSACLLLTASFLCYECFRMKEDNGEIQATLVTLSHRLGHLNHHLERVPFSAKQANVLQKTLKKSEEQQKRLWEFLDAAGKTLSGQYVLTSLTLSEENAQLAVEAPDGNMFSFDPLLEAWPQMMPSASFQVIQAMPEGYIQQAKHQEGQVTPVGGSDNPGGLTIECPSPFQEDQ